MKLKTVKQSLDLLKEINIDTYIREGKAYPVELLIFEIGQTKRSMNVIRANNTKEGNKLIELFEIAEERCRLSVLMSAFKSKSYASHYLDSLELTKVEYAKLKDNLIHIKLDTGP